MFNCSDLLRLSTINNTCEIIKMIEDFNCLPQSYLCDIRLSNTVNIARFTIEINEIKLDPRIFTKTNLLCNARLYKTPAVVHYVAENPNKPMQGLLHYTINKFTDDSYLIQYPQDAGILLSDNLHMGYRDGRLLTGPSLYEPYNCDICIYTTMTRFYTKDDPQMPIFKQRDNQHDAWNLLLIIPGPYNDWWATVELDPEDTCELKSVFSLHNIKYETTHHKRFCENRTAYTRILNMWNYKKINTQLELLKDM